jgi:hypothetical protein
MYKAKHQAAGLLIYIREVTGWKTNYPEVPVVFLSSCWQM